MTDFLVRSQMGSWGKDTIWKAKRREALMFTKLSSHLVNFDTCIYGKKETHFLNTTILGSIQSLAQTFKTQFSQMYKRWVISRDGLEKWIFVQHFKIFQLKVLCKYWARFARHVSPCVHRAFTDFSGWNVVGESGSLLVFLFWFDQLLSITDIGNYPQERRRERKNLLS